MKKFLSWAVLRKKVFLPLLAILRSTPLLVIASCLLIIITTSFNFQEKPVLAYDYAQKLFIAHEGDRPIPTPMTNKKSTVSVKGKDVNYGVIKGQNLTGYLAYPENQDKPMPALIVIHEWWGLNEHIKAMTDKLAAEGYLALAVDLYNGKVAENREKARELVTKALFNQERLRNNIKEAYTYLEEEQKAPKIGTIGWCFGGSWSLESAILLPEKIDATVIYYGGNLETNPNRLKSLQMPILGIFGELDKNPSVTQVKKLENTLQSLNKSVEIHIYEGADHAFANPSGTRYNAKAAEDAWDKTTAFLAKNLRN